MKLKYIIATVLIFILTFAVSIMIIFPYSRVVRSVLDDTITSNKLPVSYGEVSAGALSSVIKDLNVEVEPGKRIHMGDINIGYSPLSLFTRKLNVNSDSRFGTVNLRLKPDNLEVYIRADAEKIGKLKGETVNGILDIHAEYSLADGYGKYEVENSGFSYSYNNLKFNFNSLSLKGRIDGVILYIDDFKSSGQATLNATGQIKLNAENIGKSSINIAGSGNVSGFEMNFNISGTLDNPNFRYR